MLTRKLKDIVIDELSKITSEHQQARAQVTEEVRNLVLLVFFPEDVAHTHGRLLK